MCGRFPGLSARRTAPAAPHSWSGPSSLRPGGWLRPRIPSARACTARSRARPGAAHGSRDTCRGVRRSSFCGASRAAGRSTPAHGVEQRPLGEAACTRSDSRGRTRQARSRFVYSVSSFRITRDCSQSTSGWLRPSANPNGSFPIQIGGAKTGDWFEGVVPQGVRRGRFGGRPGFRRREQHHEQVGRPLPCSPAPLRWRAVANVAEPPRNGLRHQPCPPRTRVRRTPRSRSGTPRAFMPRAVRATWRAETGSGFRAAAGVTGA